MFEYRCSSIDWKPSPVVALVTSPDGSQVAAAREDGSLEVWLVSPGAVSWHCQLIIHGDPKSRISYLAWFGAGSKGFPSARLFSSSIDGTISEWDFFDLKQKVLESVGVSIWQMAVEPLPGAEGKSSELFQIGYLSEKSDDEEETEIEDNSELDEPDKKSEAFDRHLAAACDDGCVRIYYISESDKLAYYRSLPRVSGRALSVTWSWDAQRIFSGSSDGLIRCWDASLCHEVYRITVGLGGLGNGSEICIWSLLSLRCGALVSGDSTGSVQFWDSQHGTLLRTHSNHKGDVNALAAAPSHNRVFSAGADGQIILYKLAGGTCSSKDLKPSSTQKWDYIGCVRAHTHDIRALTLAVPITSEGSLTDSNAKGASSNQRRKDKPVGLSYHKWAHLGVPMLISAGDDAKLFAYSVQEFTKFPPHDICPAPQRVPMHMVHNTVFDQTSLLLVQDSCSLDIRRIHISSDSSGHVSTKPLVRVKSKDARKIICSAISNTGSLFAYSDQIRPSLFELKKNKLGKNAWSANRKRLPSLPFAHSMVFSCDCSRLITSGHDRRIYTVDIDSMELLHTLTPRQDGQEGEAPREPPITRLYTSSNDHWLAAINCFGDIYVFSLETQRQHWFISRLDGAPVAAAGFHPRDNNVLVISTSSNQVFALDMEARELGKWPLLHTFCLPKRYQEFPGEVVGLSFFPSLSSSSVIIYSSRAKCFIEFGEPAEQNEETDLPYGNLSEKLEGMRTSIGLKKLGKGTRKRRFEEYQKERKKFEMVTSKHPVLYLRHLSKNAILVIEKPWMEVIKSFDTQPVYRHLFGT